MSAITYIFKCACCDADFNAPEVPEDSYGLFVMRTIDADDTALLDAYADKAFLESYELVKRNKLVGNLDARKRGELQHLVFAEICDLGPHGDPFRIGLLPKCPMCGARSMESWEPVRPTRPWALPALEHTAWNMKTAIEKRELIDNLIYKNFKIKESEV
jgi:hypothetical protein